MITYFHYITIAFWDKSYLHQFCTVWYSCLESIIHTVQLLPTESDITVNNLEFVICKTDYISAIFIQISWDFWFSVILTWILTPIFNCSKERFPISIQHLNRYLSSITTKRLIAICIFHNDLHIKSLNDLSSFNKFLSNKIIGIVIYIFRLET